MKECYAIYRAKPSTTMTPYILMIPNSEHYQDHMVLVKAK